MAKRKKSFSTKYWQERVATQTDIQANTNVK